MLPAYITLTSWRNANNACAQRTPQSGVYRIARGSKFSRIAALKEFVEKFCGSVLPLRAGAQILAG